MIIKLDEQFLGKTTVTLEAKNCKYEASFYVLSSQIECALIGCTLLPEIGAIVDFQSTLYTLNLHLLT